MSEDSRTVDKHIEVVSLVGKVGRLEANYESLDKKVDLGFDHLGRAISEQTRDQRHSYNSLSDQLRTVSQPQKTNFSVIFSGLSLSLGIIIALGTSIIVPIINKTQENAIYIKDINETRWSKNDELRIQKEQKEYIDDSIENLKNISDLKDAITDLKSQLRSK